MRTIVALIEDPTFLATLDERTKAGDESAKLVNDQVTEINKRTRLNVHYRFLCERLSGDLEAYLESLNQSASAYQTPEVQLQTI